MKYSMARRARKVALGLYLAPLKLVSKRGFLTAIGWSNTLLTGRPLDGEGQAIPWWSFGATSFLSDRLTDKMKVFEYGAGFSTLWLSYRVGHVTSIETNKEWFARIRPMVPKNVDLRYVEYEPNGEYCRLISGYSEAFDIVVVDSRDRVRCVKNALGALKPTGVLIFDDAQMPQLQEGTVYLQSHGFRFIDFAGLGPVSDANHCTRIFYRPDNALMI